MFNVESLLSKTAEHSVERSRRIRELHGVRGRSENDTPDAVLNSERELEVRGTDVRRSERVIEPGKQVAVREQVETDHGH